jgi:hypothetical protein
MASVRDGADMLLPRRFENVRLFWSANTKMATGFSPVASEDNVRSYGASI